MVFRTSHLIIAVLLHVVVLGFLFVGFSCSKKVAPPVMIQASLVEANPRVSSRKEREPSPKKEVEPVKEEKPKEVEKKPEPKKAEPEELRRRDDQARLKLQAEVKKKALEDARKQKEEADRKQKEEQARSVEENKRQAQKEKEIEDQLNLLQQMDAEDNQRQQAAKAGKQNEWAALIQDRVRRNWLRPPAVSSEFQCKVRVELLPGGQVAGVKVLESCGNPILDDSVERAVRKSDPLPTPRDPGVFERTLDFYFKS